MQSPSAFAALIQSTLLTRMARVAGSGTMGVLVLGFVADRSGPRSGEVVVHVVEAEVEVTIGGTTYQIHDRRYEPLTRELPAGDHELVMRRGDRVIHRERFSIRGGESLVLCAWDASSREGGAWQGVPAVGVEPTWGLPPGGF